MLRERALSIGKSGWRAGFMHFFFLGVRVFYYVASSDFGSGLKNQDKLECNYLWGHCWKAFSEFVFTDLQWKFKGL